MSRILSKKTKKVRVVQSKLSLKRRRLLKMPMKRQRKRRRRKRRTRRKTRRRRKKARRMTMSLSRVSPTLMRKSLTNQEESVSLHFNLVHVRSFNDEFNKFCHYQ